MRLKLVFLIFLILPFTLTVQAVSVDDILYKEEITGYSYVNNQVYRWEMEREFIITQYELLNESSINIWTTHTQSGLIENRTQLYGEANFDMTVEFNENGSLKYMEWDIMLMRKPKEGLIGGEPFKDSKFDILHEDDNQRFDLRNEELYFTINLQYFEIMEYDGQIQKIKVNTDLATNNDESGIIEKTSIHSIKRTMDLDVISEYHRTITKVNTFQNFINIFDQPLLWVPLQFVIVFLLIAGYILIQRRVAQYDISIKRKEVPEN